MGLTDRVSRLRSLLRPGLLLYSSSDSSPLVRYLLRRVRFRSLLSLSASAFLRAFFSLRLRSSSEDESSDDIGDLSRLRLRLLDLECRVGDLWTKKCDVAEGLHRAATYVSRTGLLGEGGQILKFLLSRCCWRLCVSQPQHIVSV